MKKVRENINELFTKDSDPIKDLGIGGILLKPGFDEMYKEFREKWKQHLRDNIGSLNGKKIKGEFEKDKRGIGFKTYTFLAKTAYYRFLDEDYFKKNADHIKISPDIVIESEEGHQYYNDGNHKFYIVE